MQKSMSVLPEGYKEGLSIDLQKDKKLALLVNGLSLLIAVLTVVPVLFLVPITPLFDVSGDWVSYFLRLGALLVGMAVYMVLHEAVHGIAMKLCGTKKVKYGFTGLYAFAGSDDYYGKAAYLFIALAPVVLWGIALGVACFLVPASWFWVVYLIEVVNLSGAAGDLYVTVRFLRLPKDILVRDVGTSMTVYVKN